MEGEEVDALVARIVGDASQYNATLRSAQQATDETARHVEGAAKGIEGFTQSIQGFAGAALSGLASLGIVAWLKEARSAFNEMSSADRRLTAALDAAGEGAANSFQEFHQFAKGMAEVTTTSEAATIGMLQHAVSHGVVGQAAERAVKNAVALAAANGGAAESYIRLTAGLEEGRTTMLARMLPALRSIKDEGERATKAHEMLGRMFSVATEGAKGSSGQIQMLSNQYRQLLQQFGEPIAEFMKPIIAVQQSIVAWMMTINKEAKAAITVVASLVAGVLALKGAIATAGFMLSIIGGGTGILLAGIVAVGGAVVLWAQRFGGIISAWHAVVSAAEAAWAAIVDGARRVYAQMVPVWAAVQAVIDRVWDAVSTRATALSARFSAVASALGERLGAVFDRLLAAAIPAAVRALEAALGLVDRLIALWDKYGVAAVDAVASSAEAVVGFVEYAIPVLQAAISFIGAAWEAMSEGAVAALEGIGAAGEAVGTTLQPVFAGIRDFAVAAWRFIFGDTKFSWASIRDSVRDAILAAEFSLRHFSQAAQLAWTGARLGAVELSAEIANVFTGALPAELKWLRDNWGELFLWAAQVVGRAAVASAVNIQRLIGAAILWVRDNWEELARYAGDALYVTVADAAKGITVAVGAAARWVQDNWAVILRALFDAHQVVFQLIATSIKRLMQDAFAAVFNAGMTAFTGLVASVLEIQKQIPRLLTGAVSLKDLWKPMEEGAEQAVKAPEIIAAKLSEFKLPDLDAPNIRPLNLTKFKMPELMGVDLPTLNVTSIAIPPRVQSELEKQLRAEFDAQKDAFQQSFEEFRKQRLEEFARTAKVPDAVRAVAAKEGFDFGSLMGSSIHHGAEKELKKVDAILFGSAEAIAHIREYQDKLLGASAADRERTQSTAPMAVSLVLSLPEDVRQELDRLRTLKVDYADASFPATPYEPERRSFAPQRQPGYADQEGVERRIDKTNELLSEQLKKPAVTLAPAGIR